MMLTPESAAQFAKTFNPSRFRGRGVRRAPGVMNKLEARYAALLEQKKLAGEVVLFMFDAIKLRLADKCFYTPDFMVMKDDMTIEFHEVKGFMEDDAAVKIKVAAALFPFKILLCRIKNGSFDIEEV